MRDPELRKRLIAEEPDDPNPFFLSVTRRTESLFPLGNPPNYNPRPGDSIVERARAAGVPEKELIYDELLKDEGHAILYAPSDKDVMKVMERATDMFGKPGAVLGLGDGGAHYGMICDAAYTTYVLTQWLGNPGKVFQLAGLIRGLTSVPAQSVGLCDRGVLKPGYKADINVIDLGRLNLHAPRIAHDLPANGKRLTQKADGYCATIVSGRVTYTDGQPTGDLPGRLIRGAKPAPADAH